MNKTLLLFIISLICFYFSFQANAKSIRVMVIDTGISVSWPQIKSHVKEPLNDDYKDDHWHGTAMAGLVLENTCDEIELVSCNYHPFKKDEMQHSNDCFKRALNENIQYINYSSSGIYPFKEEKEIIKKLSDKGVIIVVSAGNNGKNLTQTGKCEGSYPACYLFKNVYIVQNIDKNGKLDPTSNYLNDINARSEIGVNILILKPDNTTGNVTGTSPAAAKYTNSLLLEKCKKLHN